MPRSNDSPRTASLRVERIHADGVRKKDSCDVVLEAAGERKIQVIEEVCALTGPGWGEANTVVDGAPGVVLESANKETAEKAKAAFDDAGAKVPLKETPTYGLWRSPFRRRQRFWMGRFVLQILFLMKWVAMGGLCNGE